MENLIEVEGRFIRYDGNYIVVETDENPYISSTGISKKGNKWSLRIEYSRIGTVVDMDTMKWILKNGMDTLIDKQCKVTINLKEFWNRKFKTNKMILNKLEIVMLEYL